MIEITNKDLVKKKGIRAYVYKRKHNIKNNPINEDKKQSNNFKKIIIIILLLLLLIFLILFLGIFFGLKTKKRDNKINNVFLDCDDDYVLVNEKCIKYSFKAIYQTKEIMKKLN